MEVKFDGAKGTISANAKTFKTGSTGYFGAGKIEINGERYQVSCNVVKIGSKAAAQGSALVDAAERE